MNRAHHHHGREHARTQTEYAGVTGTIVQTTKNAILVSTGERQGWIPRRALSAASKVQMVHAMKDQSVTIQIELRLAMEKGLV